VPTTVNHVQAPRVTTQRCGVVSRGTGEGVRLIILGCGVSTAMIAGRLISARVMARVEWDFPATIAPTRSKSAWAYTGAATVRSGEEARVLVRARMRLHQTW